MNSYADLKHIRQNALGIFQTGIAAADPYQAVKNSLTVQGRQLIILPDDNKPDRQSTGLWKKVHIIAFGKAACRMSQAAMEVIPQTLLAQPIIAVTNYDNVLAIDGVEVIGAGHPLPDQAGALAAEKIIRQVKSAATDELVLVLISGGGSALIPCPMSPVTLQEKIATTTLLLNSGATIDQVNCIRKHLSQLKGGRLAKLAAPAALHALILSDVLGDNLSSIASGPTVPDDSTYQDAITLCQHYDIWQQLPDSVRRLLTEGAENIIAETGKAHEPFFQHCRHTLIGSNRISLQAIIKSAQDCHYQTRLYSDHLVGEASVEAEKLVLYAKKIIAADFNRPIALLAGGETTVTLKGKGLGGRNQEMALAFAIAAKKYNLTGQWVFLSAGTDGRDGPTDAAGGMVDSNSINRIMANNIDPAQRLANNDSYHALQSAQDLVIIGATGTNVADLQILLIHPN